MKKNIQYRIKQIEAEHNIRVLLACETGSRAWGFPSPDSDYDIRMIYVHPKDWYISVKDKKDTIEMMLDNGDLDITGWELRKALRLLSKSNAALLERIQSAIVYQKDDLFVNEINNLAGDLYSPIATMYHYLSLAKKFYAELEEGDTVKLKSMFYGLRSAIACQWIMEENSYPPILFQAMLNTLKIDRGCKIKINTLIKLKSKKNEDYRHKKDEDLLQLIQQIIEKASAKANMLNGALNKQVDLDNFLLKWVK